jgi:predicted TIM-barrel fold metal-dependent hydrolase
MTKFPGLSAAFIASQLLSLQALAQPAPPIIDMHLHSYDEDTYFRAPDRSGRMAPADAQSHFHETYQALKQYNIVLAVISGSEKSEAEWVAADTDHRFLRGLGSIHSEGWTPDKFEELVKKKQVAIFGEIGAYYRGQTLADPFYAPYLAICERYGIPVAIHTGGGPPGVVYRGSPDARLMTGNPLLIEDVLVKYPRLKIYLMHAGERFYQQALQLMLSYPRIYADLGVMLWADPAVIYYGEQFLRQAQAFGMLDRIMFGTDQMVWPHATQASLEQLEAFDFLTEENKRDILYNNAAQFLGLSEAEIAAHHGR